MTRLLEPSPVTGDAAATWRALVARHDDNAPEARGDTPVHAPEAAVLACSDARVPPSVLFDAEPGTLFVVRHAGNTASATAVASLDYAVERLGVPLVVVMGHSDCGAVTAAFEGVDEPRLAPVVEPVAAVIARDRCPTIDAAIEANVVETVTVLAAGDGPLGRAVRAGDAAIHGVVEDLATGELRPVISVPGAHRFEPSESDPGAHQPETPESDPESRTIKETS